MMLFHGSCNAAHALLYLFYDDLPASEQYLYWIYVALNIVAALVVILLRRRKTTNPPITGKDE